MSGQTPRKIGRYELNSVLGQGGMATVYLARDPHFGRDVAVKMLPRQFLFDPTFRDRFEREARTVASLEHPAIVPVYDFGEEQEQPYLVMRYMAGGSLLDRMRKGPLSIQEIEEILRRVGSALDYAHTKGVIHRDLKPGNIMFDGQGNAFLSDFGIAKLTESTSTLTGSGIIGTPAYMSPEQIQGERDLDGRSDVYALGVILFEMLTGHSPFRADTPAKVMMKHVLDPVPRLRQVKPDLDPVYDTVVGRALAKKRDERYLTAGALSAGLKQAATGQMSSPFDEGTMIEPLPVESAPAEATMLEHPTPPPPQRQAAPPPPRTATPAQPRPAPAPPKEKKRGIPIWVWVGGALALFVCLGLGAGAIILGSGFLGGDETATPQDLALQATDEAVETAAPEASDTAEAALNPPTDTLESAAATSVLPTDTPGPTRVPITFARVEDDSGRISLQLPDSWEVQTIEEAVAAAPDLDDWFDSFGGDSELAADAVGFFITVLTINSGVDDAYIDNLFSDYDFPYNCPHLPANDESYDDGLYVGVYTEAPCDEGATFVLILAYDPDAPEGLIWLESVATSEQDREIVQQAFDTFVVIPVAGGALLATPTIAPTPVTVGATDTLAQDVSAALLNQMRVTRGDMESMGGMIDGAINSGSIDCSDVVNTYDRVSNSPTFGVGGSSQKVINAHTAYRNSVAVFVDGNRDLSENCRAYLADGGNGTIPFSQWGLARQSVNDALDILNPAIASLES